MRGRERIPRGLLLIATGLAVASTAVGLAAAASDDVRRRLGFDAGDPLVLDPCVRGSGDVQRPPVAPVLGTWRAEHPLPVPRDEMRAATVGRRVLLAGGHRTGEGGRLTSVGALLVFDPDTGRFERGPDLPRPLDHTEAVSAGGRLYLVGGFSDHRERDEVWSYSPERRRWRLVTRLRRARGSATAAVIGHRLYVVGGAPPTTVNPEAQPFRSLEVYDLRTGRWSAGPDIPTARHHTGAAAVGGKLYVVGGRLPRDFSLATVERFDPRRGSWDRLPDLPQGAGGLGVAAVAGQLVAIAGGDDRERWVTPAAWRFDPAKRAWRRLPDLRTARHGHATAAVGGRVYVFGGAPCPGYGRTATVESLEVRR